MVKQEIIWKSVKEDGNPKKFVNGGFVFVVKYKHTNYYELKSGSYNTRLKIWFESTEDLDSVEVDARMCEVLYYTSDLNYINIRELFGK